MDEADKEMPEWLKNLNREMKPWIDSPSIKERESLNLFCEIIDELEESSIFKNLLHRRQIRHNQKWRSGILVEAGIEDFNEEELKAFLLTARLLSQDNDRISIGNIATVFNKLVSERHSLSMNFNAYHMGLNEYLDRRDHGLSHTNREIFEIFLYGHYAHRNKNKEDTYRKWKADRILFLEMKVNFLSSVGNLFSSAQRLRSSVKQLLTLTSAGI